MLIWMKVPLVYKYEELRPFADIMKEVEELESEIALEIRKVLG